MLPVDAKSRAPVTLLDQLTAKPMGASRTELSRVVWRADENIFGSGKGTLVLELVDDVAWATAARHSDGHAMTVSVEQTFIAPIWTGDILSGYAQVEDTGRTSMEIGVYVSAQRRGSGLREPVAEAHMVFVAVDEQGAPRPVRPVHPETDADYASQRAVAVRRAHRRAMAAALADTARSGE